MIFEQYLKEDSRQDWIFGYNYRFENIDDMKLFLEEDVQDGREDLSLTTPKKFTSDDKYSEALKWIMNNKSQTLVSRIGAFLD